jgi:cyclophilin family peptidyl-prolyl cis-trans isomerase/HEAT repeat protein
MTDARRIDDTLIVAGLSAKAPSIRVATTLAVGQVKARMYRPRLVALLADPDTTVAATAAYALALLRDTANAATTAVALGTALAGPVTVGTEAAWALGELGSAGRHIIDSVLVAVLAPPAPPVPVDNTVSAARAMSPPPPPPPVVAPLSPRVTEMLLLSASKMRPVSVAAIVPHLRSKDPRVARNAAYALSRSSVPGAVRALADQMLARDEELRAHVARGLAKGAAGDSLADIARRALDYLAETRHPHVRINAIRSLATYGDVARVQIIAATRDSNPNVRLVAAQSLTRVMDRDLIRWAWLWESDTAFTYRKTVLDASMRAGVELPALREWRLSDDWRKRAALATAASAAPSAIRAVEMARPLTREVDPRVRAAGYTALAQRMDSVPGTIDSLRAALSDRDPTVRAAILGSLTRRASAADAPRAATVYRRSVADTVNDARVAAIRYLASAWRRDSAAFSDSLKAVIADLPQPPDPEVTAAARGASIFRSWTPMARPTPSLDWYEDVVRRVVLPGLGGTHPRAELVTSRGTIVLELFAVDAPLTVNSFTTLAARGLFADTRFHRVVPNFVAQGGDPTGTGSGGPGYSIRDELNRHRYERGTLGMAHSGPDTGGSQFFIAHSPQPHLDGLHTVFGRVIAGLNVLDAIVEGDRLIEVRVR